MRWTSHLTLATLLTLAGLARAEVSDRFPLTLKLDIQPDRLVITRDIHDVATYVFRDESILRPYFTDVYANAYRITRPLPRRTGVGVTDHADMHPGLWLAFGDLGGGDFWRNKGRVEHVEFVEPPTAKIDGKDGVVSFVARNRYRLGEQTICEELARHTIRATRSGYLFTFDSQFSGERPFAFGDQEEMGLGLRVAAELTVKSGGTILNSEGRQNEQAVWGRQADWCDYSGVITTKLDPPATNGQTERKSRAGLLLIPHPENFRRSWMHVRDYGLLVANPFGERAFTKSPPSSITVKAGEKLRLRYGVWAHAANLDEKTDFAALAAEYLTLVGPKK